MSRARRRSIWSTVRSGAIRIPHALADADPFVGLPDAALGLLVRMCLFADRNETDGRITDAQMRQLQRGSRTPAALSRLNERAIVTRLHDGSGWEIVGFLDAHRTAEQIEQIRDSRRSAGSKGGRSKAARAVSPDQDPGDNPDPFGDNVLPPCSTPIPTPSQLVPEPNRDLRGRDDRTQAERDALDLYGAMLLKLGYLDPDTRIEPAELAYAADCIQLGWSPAVLGDLALEVAGKDLRDSREYLLGCIRRRAAGAEPLPPPPPLPNRAADDEYASRFADYPTH